MAYMKNNQKDKGKAALKKALKLDGKFPGHKDALKALEDKNEN